MKHVVIVGGGISGLSAAYRLQELIRERKLPLRITLLEERERFGGVIQTEFRDGFLLESGPDAFLAEKPWALELCRKMGLESELEATQPECRRSFVLHRGKLAEVPAGFYLLAPTRMRTLLTMPHLSWRGKLRMACEPFIAANREDGDESVGRFVRRRFGREAYDRIGQPMIGGIYAADPDRLSLRATFPVFRDMEENHGSILRAIRKRKGDEAESVDLASGPRYNLFVSLKGGMESLTRALVVRLRDVKLLAGCRIRRLIYQEGWKIELESAEPLRADALCLAIPAYRAADLVRDLARDSLVKRPPLADQSSSPEPSARDLARKLDEIPYESVATVHVGYRDGAISPSRRGFGFVVPRIEERPLMGCTFSSVKFAGRAPDGLVLLRAFVGGAFHAHLLELDDRDLGEKISGELNQILGIRERPLFMDVRRHPRSMPQYVVGHLDRVALIRKEADRFRGLTFTGNAFEGIGIPDCIRQSEAAAEKIAREILDAS